MAFNHETLVRIGGQPQALSVYTYKTGDALSAVTAENYFKLGFIKNDDLVNLLCADGVYLLKVVDGTATAIADFNIGDASGSFIFVSSKDDLPDPVNGVITLEAEKTYLFIGDVDLQGDRIVTEEDVCILGPSSENASLTSTGLGSDWLITADWTMHVRHILFKDVDNCIGINLLNNSTDTNLALDWTGVNFQGCNVNVRAGDIDNFIFDKGAILGSGSFQFFGQAGTIGIANSIFIGDGSSYAAIEIESTANITRRFRTIYSSFVAFGSTNAISVDPSATINNESYILDTCNFSGGGTYLAGVDSTDNKSLFVNNVGIPNSSDISQYFMNGNVVATTILAIGAPIKAAGSTTSSIITSKFTNSDNRATYNGALTKFFKVSASLSLTSGNNRQLSIYIAKNGAVINDSIVNATASGNGRSENVVSHTLVELTADDYVEIFVANETDTQNITVTDLNVIIE